MSLLTDYLATIPNPLQRTRAAFVLAKRVRLDSEEIVTEADIVGRALATGDARLQFYSDTGKKRDGLRLPKMPKWSIWSGDCGTTISRTGANFANYCLKAPHDLDAVEAPVIAAYKKAHNDNAPQPRKSWW